MTRQETINKAVAWAVNAANDNSHGYAQDNRWGPDYDCSSFVISAWQQAGVPVREAGASYTGNMYAVFTKCGFCDVTSRVNLSTGAGLQKGDVLLNHKSHTEMYIGDGKTVRATINENGGIVGGHPGDQTGREICVGAYYNFPWNAVLRYDAENADPERAPLQQTCTITLPVLRKGDRGDAVRALQTLLIMHKCNRAWTKADGIFGPLTDAAVRRFQKQKDIGVDGICGAKTWTALIGGVT